jgi:hypothetical protein
VFDKIRYFMDEFCEHIDFASYLVHIQLTAAERSVLNLCTAMWGRAEIEGRVLCRIYMG